MKRNVYVSQFQSASWKNLLPLSAAMLVSYARSILDINDAFDIEIDILRRNPAETAAAYVDPDVLAFSTYSWNFRQSLEVARLAKRSSPESLVVFGGPMMPDKPADSLEFLRMYPFVDVIVHGMGEWVFSDILLASLGTKDLRSIPGVSYLDPANALVSNPLLWKRDLNELPSPFLDGTCDEIMETFGDRITGALWETNRGCPYQCSYCVWGNTSYRNILTYDMDRLSKELEWLGEKKMSYLFGTDANFGILPRDVEIVRKIAALKRRTGYPENFIVNWLKNSSEKMVEIADILRRGGVNTRVTLSMQSFNERTLEAIKRQNMRLDVFEEVKKKASQRNIPTYTELILALPCDTYASIKDNIVRCMDRYLTHYFVVYLCRLLDGTEMALDAFRERYGIETRTSRVMMARHELVDGGVEETEQIIVATSSLPVEDWERAFAFVYMSLTLYNFRLAFFPLNYLRAEYDIDIGDVIEYIISEAEDGATFPVIHQAVAAIREGSESILNEQPYFASLDFMGRRSFDVHETALLFILNNKDEFYEELRQLVDRYLKVQDIEIQRPVLREVFKYQAYRVPVWKACRPPSLFLEYNIPHYFHSLCVEDRHSPIRKQNTKVDVVDACDGRGDPIAFAQQRLTATTLEIYDIHYTDDVSDAIGNRRKICFSHGRQPRHRAEHCSDAGR